MDRNLIHKLVSHQVDNLFFINETEKELLDLYYPDTEQRVRTCFAASANKYYHHNGEVRFFTLSFRPVVYLPLFSCQQHFSQGAAVSGTNAVRQAVLLEQSDERPRPLL